MLSFILFIFATIHFFFISSIQSSNFRQLYQRLNEVRFDSLEEEGNPFNDFDIPNSPPDVLSRIFSLGIGGGLLSFINSNDNYGDMTIRICKEKIKNIYIYEIVSNYVALLLMLNFIRGFIF